MRAFVRLALATTLLLAGDGASARGESRLTPEDWVLRVGQGRVDPELLAGPAPAELDRRARLLSEELFAFGPPHRALRLPQGPGEGLVLHVTHPDSSTILEWRLIVDTDGRLVDVAVDLRRPVAPEGFVLRLSGDLFVRRAEADGGGFPLTGPGVAPGGGAVRATDLRTLIDYLAELRILGSPLPDSESHWRDFADGEPRAAALAWEWVQRVKSGNWDSSRLTERFAETARDLDLPEVLRRRLAEHGPAVRLRYSGSEDDELGTLHRFTTEHADGKLLSWVLGTLPGPSDRLRSLEVDGPGEGRARREAGADAASGAVRAALAPPPPTLPERPGARADLTSCVRVTWWPRLSEPCVWSSVPVEGTREVVFEVYNACDTVLRVDLWLLSGFTTVTDQARLRAPRRPRPLRVTAWEGRTFEGTRLEPLSAIQRVTCNWMGEHRVVAAPARLDGWTLIDLQACSEAGSWEDRIGLAREAELLPARGRLLRSCTPPAARRFVADAEPAR